MTAAEIYTTKDLATFLITYMRSEQGILQRLLQMDARRNPLIGGVRIDQVAAQLKTPERVEDFVRHLCVYARSGPVTAQHVRESIIAVQRNHNPLLEWYYRLREPRRQLLALAICFFDGLFEQQFFAAVDILIAQAWRQRDPAWHAIDYDDLGPLERFYEFVVRAGSGKSIKTRSREQRRMLLAIVWERHRRSIVSALPVFYHCIKESIDAPHKNIELYGSRELCAQLRTTLGDTLSDIGLQDRDTVAPFLLRLAIDRHIGIQTVAARAIARWREHAAHEQAFDLLATWTSPDIADVIASIAEPTRGRERQLIIHLKETLALTVGHAGRVDSPNRMARELVEILERLGNEDRSTIQEYLASYTIPMLVPAHLRQIQQVVLQLMAQTELHEALVNCLTQAYSKQPDDVRAMLDAWCDLCLASLANEVDTRQTARWAHMLACICNIYERLPYFPADVDVLLTRMQRVLAEVQYEGHARATA